MLIRFAHPYALLLLLALPPIVYLAFRRRASPRMRFSSIRLLGKPGVSLRLLLRPLPRVLLLGALSLMIVAFARPQIPWKEQKRKTEGISIMIVFDVSESMRALDFEPNRLEKSKKVVREFVKGRTDDQIGLVIFGKETFTLCPLTRDYAALDAFVERINFDLLDGNMTAIGMGLANGVNKIKDAKTKSKVIVLLTDGENNWGDIPPLTAADLAKQLGIRVYTIGVGSKGMVDIPVQTATGQWVTMPNMSNIDAPTLKKIAGLTGGEFFEANDGRSLEQIWKQIDQMERTKIESSDLNYFDELAQYLLAPALLMFGLALLLEQTWLWSFP